MYPYFYIGEIRFSTYAACILVGAVLSVALLTYFWRSKKMLHVFMPSLAIGFIGLALGAKLFGIVSKSIYNKVETGYWDINDSIFNSGIVYWGGLLGFLAAIYLNCRLRNKDFSDIINSLAIVIPLFHGFGRLGCYFAGCCYGRRDDGFFSLPYRLALDGEWEKRLPVQLIEAGFEFALFVILFSLYLQRRQKKEVHFINFYLILYSVFRFMIEFFRGDTVRGVIVGLSFSQIISMIVFITISTIIIQKRGIK